MSRNEAQRNLNLKSDKAILDKQGIIHTLKDVNSLDEATSAYKDISVVMENQKELVDIVTELQPLAVIKG